jgi:hypothetical protein
MSLKEKLAVFSFVYWAGPESIVGAAGAAAVAPPANGTPTTSAASAAT